MKKKKQPAVTAAFEAQVRKWVDRYTPILGLSHIRIELNFADTCDLCDENADLCAAHFYRFLPYRNAKMVVHSKLAKEPVDYQERVIIHEMAHDVTAELSEMFRRVLVQERLVPWHAVKDLVESTVDRVTQIVWEMARGKGK